MEADRLVRAWRGLIVGPAKSWVLFRNGTCVILMSPGEDLAADARALLKAWGMVAAGSPAGDFNVITPHTDPGRVVTCHHPDILSYVGEEEIDGGRMPVVQVGLIGRARRDRDARELEIIHVEHGQPSIPQ